MYRVFILTNKDIKNGEVITSYILINTNSDFDAEKMNSQDTWEMPQQQVSSIFGDKVGMACNENTTFEPDGKGGFTNFVFTPPAVDIEKLKQRKVNEAITAYDTAISNLAKNYPTNEMLTFTQQLEQAQNITAQTNLDDIELVKGISVGRQITQEELAPKILLKNKMFQYPCGVFLGRKQRVQDLVEQAQTEQEVMAIDVQAIFAEPIPQPEAENL